MMGGMFMRLQQEVNNSLRNSSQSKDNDSTSQITSKEFLESYSKIMEKNKEEQMEITSITKTESQITSELNDSLRGIIGKLSELPQEYQQKHINILMSAISKVNTQIDKDVQYNGAFDKSVDIFGGMYFSSKIYEKTMRIIHLTKGNESSFESLEDSLEDCAGYCLLALERVRRDNKKEQQKRFTLPQM